MKCAMENKKKSTLTIYADLDLDPSLGDAETEIARLKDELLNAQKALNKQTKRCKQLVEEYTRQLRDKDFQFEYERMLRDDQLGKVLRALLLVEARLKQEQKLIKRQLKEKDFIIQKQNYDLQRLSSSSHYCNNCNQYYNAESMDSSSEYVVTDYQESNFGSLDSSSEIYATLSDTKVEIPESKPGKPNYRKNPKDHPDRKIRKFPHRRSVGSYFEVLQLRNDATSPVCSNEDNTSNDYDNFDSLPTESVVSEESGTSLAEKNSDQELESNITVIRRDEKTPNEPFEVEETETNDKWYVNASDQEDEQQKNVYRNNPVLECVNQILLQDMNSPPKTPTLERKLPKGKKVKFSDETETCKNDYYETPIQKIPNYYEIPQSIYSNDYEQILSKCEETFSSVSIDQAVIRKNKILRTPPALPPKPVNLVSKYKINATSTDQSDDQSSSEPDYCSISELNLPTQKRVTSKTIQVVAEINEPPPTTKETQTATEPVTDIPKLPQVSEIIIPEETEETKIEETVSSDNYVKNNSTILKTTTTRRPISIGTSVSSLIMGFNNMELMYELNKKPPEKSKPPTPKKVAANVAEFENKTRNITNTSDDFNLNQNFEEFKLDDCEIEEYELNEKPSSTITENELTTIPDLNRKSLELLKRHIQQKTDNYNEPTYEHFLECTGLSSKSILTPARPNNKPKSKTNRNVKYWQEPYI